MCHVCSFKNLMPVCNDISQHDEHTCKDLYQLNGLRFAVMFDLCGLLSLSITVSSRRFIIFAVQSTLLLED